MVDHVQTQCCIAGCGPAGAVLGLILARAGIDVTVLEKHGDFLRDFRGDDISPSTMEILDELGLAEGFLDLDPKRMPRVVAHSAERSMTLADLSGLRSPFPYVAVIPQWDFLNFLVKEAGTHPGFHLMMNAEVTDVLDEDGAVRGVRYRSGGVTKEIRAPLTIAADGRTSLVREQAGLPLVELRTPIDLLWFRLPRTLADPEETAISIYLGSGRAIGRMNRGEYWQVAYVIPKGAQPQIRDEGIEAFRASVGQIVPDLADRVGSLRGWDEVSLLSVTSNRLRRWYRPGLLCIGDAAHAMSPIGGVGINFAIQDAVSAANHLVEPLRRGEVPVRALRAVQRQRSRQVRFMQMLQARLTGAVLLAVHEDAGPVRRFVRNVGGRMVEWRPLLAIRSRVIGRGIGRRVRLARDLRPGAPN